MSYGRLSTFLRIPTNSAALGVLPVVPPSAFSHSSSVKRRLHSWAHARHLKASVRWLFWMDNEVGTPRPSGHSDSGHGGAVNAEIGVVGHSRLSSDLNQEAGAVQLGIEHRTRFTNG